jgi:hypothetical protein
MNGGLETDAAPVNGMRAPVIEEDHAQDKAE